MVVPVAVDLNRDLSRPVWGAPGPMVVPVAVDLLIQFSGAFRGPWSCRWRLTWTDIFEASTFFN